MGKISLLIFITVASKYRNTPKEIDTGIPQEEQQNKTKQKNPTSF